MKRLTYFLLLLILSPPSVNAQSSRFKVQASLINGVFKLNKTLISPDWKLQNANKALGNAQRYNEGANKVYLYDSVGMIIFENKKANRPTGVINEIDIFFSIKESGNLTPSNLFSGSFEVENINISKDTKIDDIEKILLGKGYKKKADKWFVKNGTYILFNYQTELLESVSVGKG